MLDLDGAAAGEALRVLEHEAARGDRPGVDADVALDDDLEAACWPGATKATAGAARRARASLAILMSWCLRTVWALEQHAAPWRLSSGCGRGARRGEFESALWQRALARTPGWLPRCQCARARQPSGSRGSNVATCRGRDLLALPKRRRKPRNSLRRTISS